MKQQSKKAAPPTMVEQQDLQTETFNVTLTFSGGKFRTGSPLALMADKKLMDSLPESFAARVSFLAGMEYTINQRKRRNTK